MLVPKNQNQLSTNTFVHEWEIMKEQANILMRTGFLPAAIKGPEQCIAIMMKGKEIGMQPMQALSHINIIQGKPTISAEGMLALVFKAYPGTKLDYIQNDDESCEIEVTKPGGKLNRWSFSIEDAKKAGLTGKDSWNKYTRAMLRSRCISEMCRAMFPDAIQGISYTPEELEDSFEVKYEEPKREVVKEVPKVSNTPLENIIQIFNQKLDIEPSALACFMGVESIEDLTEAHIPAMRKLYEEMSKKEREVNHVS